MKRAIIALSVLLIPTAIVHAATWTATGLGSFGGLEKHSGTISWSNGVLTCQKPSGENRVEVRDAKGFPIREFRTYEVQWEFNLSKVVSTNAIFQWKAYGDQVHDHPIVLSTSTGFLNLNKCPNDKCSGMWRQAISANKWYRVKLRIYTDRNPSKGRISLWLDGVLKVNNQPAPTFDAIIRPKWGVYGGQSSSITNRMRNMTIKE